MLEFLYTGNYSLPDPKNTSRIPMGGDRNIPEMDTHPTGEPSRKPQSGNIVIDKLAVYWNEQHNQTVTEPPENTPESLIYAPHMKEKQDSIGESSGKYAIKEEAKGAITERVVDSLIDCHPCYFHVRMYGEADYFMISDLKSKAEVHFCASFMASPERESFAETIEELYSTRANYQELKQLAIGMIVDNLPTLRKGLRPVITSELMKSIPEFTYDLFQATLDKYVDEPSDMEGNYFRTGFFY